MNQPQALDILPPAEVGEPEPDELDKLIDKTFPDASPEAKAKVRARAIKRNQRKLESESHRQAPIVSRIEGCKNIEAVNLMRTAIAHGLHKGSLDPDRKTLDRWQNAVWGKVIQLMLQCERPGPLCYIYNSVRSWHKEPSVAQLLEHTFTTHIAKLPNDAQWLLQQGIEIEGVTKLPA